MAAGDASTGMGATVTFQSGLIAKIENLDLGPITREAIQILHSDLTGGIEYIPHELYDPGEMTATVIFNDTEAYQTAVAAAAEAVTVTFPNNGSTARTHACSGFMTEYSIAIPMDDKMTTDVTIKFTGDITETVAT